MRQTSMPATVEQQADIVQLAEPSLDLLRDLLARAELAGLRVALAVEQKLPGEDAAPGLAGLQRPAAPCAWYSVRLKPPFSAVQTSGAGISSPAPNRCQ